MATELVVKTDRVQRFFDDLEAQKSFIFTCTCLFTTLTNRFTSLQQSLSQKSQSLEFKIQALQKSSREILRSLDILENSIPNRESVAASRVEEQKNAALIEFEKLLTGNMELSEALKSFSRKMDSGGLVKFIVSKRKESMSLRAEIVQALAEAVDPPKLVLDSVEDLVISKSAKAGVTDKRWACAMLVQALFPEINSNSKGPEFSRSIVERAVRILEQWKRQIDCELEGKKPLFGAAEAVMFVQIVAGFRLSEKFDGEFLRKLMVEHASRRDMAKIAAALEDKEKMEDIINELVKSGKELEAIYFASESGLTAKFPPIDLLKTYLKNSKNNASSVSKKGNSSLAASEESNNLEFNSIKAIIRCVEDHKLESEFPLDSLRKRATNLEKTKAARKKNSTAANKPQNKRAYSCSSGRGGGGSSSLRPSKAAKYSIVYPSFSRKNTNPPARYSSPYSYPSHGLYEASNTVPYASTYGVSHSHSHSHAPSSAAIPQQHYSLPGDSISAAAAYRTSGSYGEQASYGTYKYDYANAAASTYPTSSYSQ